MNSNNDATTEFYNDLVLATAIRLIKENGSTTTLDIKNELRNRHATIDVSCYVTFRPDFTQNIVSDAMIVLADNSYFSYDDNGTYRTYYLNTVEFREKDDDDEVETTLNVSQFDAINIINRLVKGDEIIITFTKHDDSLRTIIGTVYSPNMGLGYMLVYDIELPDGSDGTNIRTVELRKLISFEIENIKYIVDKSIKK